MAESKKNKKNSNGPLSQNEIDQLLNAISSADSKTEDFKSKDNRRIKVYDFKRPDRFSKEQIRRCCNIFEQVSRRLTTMLSATLRSLVHVHVASVDQLTFEEFLRCIPTPSTLSCANWEGEAALIEIDPPITFAFFHCMNSDKFVQLDMALDDIEVDGKQLSDIDKSEILDAVRYVFYGGRINRDLTDLEFIILKNTIIEPIYSCITSEFNKWQGKQFFMNTLQDCKRTCEEKDLEPLSEPQLIRMENNPQFVEIAPGGEMVLLVTLEVKVADEAGMMNICLPYPFVKNVLMKKEIIMSSENLNPYALKVFPGNSGVSLGEFNMPEGEKLEEGNIIELNKMAGEPVDLYDKETGKVFARGEVVVIDENFGVRVTEVL